MPFSERQNVYKSRSWMVPIPGFICPSRRVAESFPVVNDEHGIYEGGGWTWAKTDYAGNALMMTGQVAQTERRRNKRIREVTDGTSQTILVGEKAMDPIAQPSTTWYWDEPYFLGGSGSTARRGLSVLRDEEDNEFKQNWGAAHPGGALFLFHDGSVRLLAHGTNWQRMSALLTPAGGEVQSDLE